jgi:hypothetical protein
VDQGAADRVEHEIVIDLRDVERPRRDEPRCLFDRVEERACEVSVVDATLGRPPAAV